LLPRDIVVRQAEEVPEDFHARYSARRKTYVYIIRNHSTPSALGAPYAWHVPQALALPAMRAAARGLLGRHDFSAFRAASCTARDPWRCLFCLRIVRHAERLVFVLNADGFLQHMARTIVGTLVAIGRAQLLPDAMATILQSGQRSSAGPTAPAHGLFLVRVIYDPDETLKP
jgi:tRNA pseudouridine38-40 synthase